MAGHLTLRLLGTLQIALDGVPIETDRRKAVALLAYLAITRKAYSRETLATLFWPEYEPSKAYAYLRRTLWEINQVLGEGWLEADRETVNLQAGASVWVDVLQFQALLEKPADRSEAGPRLNEAVALYGGDFLPGLALRDSPGFEAWQRSLAENLRRQFGEALQALTQTYTAQGEYDAAIAQARHWLALDALNEAAHRQLMELFALTGQRNVALRQYETCVQVLKAELDVSPEAATTAVYQRIKAEGGAAPITAPAPGPRPPLAPRLNLPSPPTPFVGREAELGQIAGLLASATCRLLTLVGPGGMGKTRLGIEAARAQADTFSQGIYFVALAPLSSPNLLIPAMADALKFSFRTTIPNEPAPPDARTQLLDYVREKQLLLVMDNFEHLVDGAELLSAILAAAPGAKILVTSRERLYLPEEIVLEISGMRLPEAGQTQQLEDYSAIKLFLQNAQRVWAGFAPAEAERLAISRICRQVEGMPLGIELAAGWVKTLTCQEIAQEIERNLDFLRTSLRGVPERHRSLRAVFEQSWARLTEAERDVFRKLSVFQGGFTREAAAQVAGASLAQLSTLIDKSLLRRSASGHYELHERLKQFAADKLAEIPAAQAETQQWHSDYYLEMLANAEEPLKGPAQKEVLTRLASDTDNLRAAWRWAVANGRVAEMERAAGALFLLYDMQSRLHEAEELFHLALEKLRHRQAADAGDQRLTAVLAIVAACEANVCWATERPAEARQLGHESLALSRQLPFGLPAARILSLLQFGEGLVGEAETETWYHQCVAVFQTTNQLWELANAHRIWGEIAEGRRGKINEAWHLYAEALQLSRRLDDRRGMAMTLNNLAAAAYWRGEYAEARQFALEMLAKYEAIDDLWQMVQCRLNLGQIETAVGDYEAAKRYYQTNLDLLEVTGQRRIIASHLDCLGYVEFLQGHYQAAEHHDRRSLEISRQLGSPRMTAMSLNNLGDALQGQRLYPQAKQCYLEALTMMQQAENGLWWVWGRAKTLKNLGKLALTLGDDAEAGDYLSQALQTALQAGRTAETLEIVVGLARLEHHAQRPLKSIEMLARVLCDAAVPRDVRADAEVLLNELSDQLPPDDVEAARQRGQRQDLSAWLNQD